MAEKKLFRFKVNADVNELQSVLDFVERCVQGLGCSPKAMMQINVAVEEVFVNIARYGYSDKTGEVVIYLEKSFEPKTVTITFIDSGVKFDPLAKPDPDITLSAKDRKIGGLGIFMTKKLMDELSYEYRDGHNVLSMKKKTL